MAERLYATNVIDWICLLGGMTMTALGGFVAGRMAPRRELTHATVVGCLSLMAGMLTSAGICPFSDWFVFTGLVLTVPMAQLGGAFASLYTTCRGQSAT